MSCRPPVRIRIVRCPECGATDAGSDESRSFVDITCMQCNACGYSEHVDHYQLGEDWNLEIEHVDGHPLPEYVEPLSPGEGFYASLARMRERREQG